jgi:hypothetical protein
LRTTYLQYISFLTNALDDVGTLHQLGASLEGIDWLLSNLHTLLHPSILVEAKAELLVDGFSNHCTMENSASAILVRPLSGVKEYEGDRFDYLTLQQYPGDTVDYF